MNRFSAHNPKAHFNSRRCFPKYKETRNSHWKNYSIRIVETEEMLFSQRVPGYHGRTIETKLYKENQNEIKISTSNQKQSTEYYGMHNDEKNIGDFDVLKEKCAEGPYVTYQIILYSING